MPDRIGYTKAIKQANDFGEAGPTKRLPNWVQPGNNTPTQPDVKSPGPAPKPLKQGGKPQTPGMPKWAQQPFPGVSDKVAQIGKQIAEINNPQPAPKTPRTKTARTTRAKLKDNYPNFVRLQQAVQRRKLQQMGQVQRIGHTLQGYHSDINMMGANWPDVPGGIVLPLLILGVLVILLLPVNGYTRIQWLWKTLTQSARVGPTVAVPQAQTTGAGFSDFNTSTQGFQTGVGSGPGPSNQGGFSLSRLNITAPVVRNPGSRNPNEQAEFTNSYTPLSITSFEYDEL